MNLKDFEIMAPVGSRDALAAALKAGADSVYFGVEQLNMLVITCFSPVIYSWHFL